jgi:hypothetical protein
MGEMPKLCPTVSSEGILGHNGKSNQVSRNTLIRGLSLRKRGLFPFIFYAETAAAIMEVTPL